MIVNSFYKYSSLKFKQFLIRNTTGKSKMISKKVITIFLFTFICHTIVAQLDEGSYKGFKTFRKDEEGPNLMNIYVNKFASSKIINLSDNKNKPLDGRFHIIIHADKYIIADIRNGILDGEWTLYWQNNKVAEKAFFKQGKREGETHEYYNGHEVRTHKDGVIQHHIAHFENGQLKEERFYENGKLHGNVKEYRQDGSLRQEANFLKGNKHGKFMKIYDNGYTEISYYTNGKLDGEYLKMFENGNTAKKGSYINGEKTGQWIEMDDQGRLKEEAGYLDGKLHGENRKYSQGELFSSVEYAHGKNHGKRISYFTPQQTIREEESFVDNVLDGYTKYYTKEGILYTEILYKNGKQVLKRDYDIHSGILNTEYTYRDNNVIREKVYDKNGKLKLLRLANEYGSLVDVQEYNNTGKIIKTNTEYKKLASIKLIEDASGIIDIDIK